MLLCFYREDGSPHNVRQYVGPGRSYFDQLIEVCSEFAHAEGEVVKFHTGHGVFRDYRVAARDDYTVLLQRV